MDGLLIVDKPEGPTSHDVVVNVRRALRERRIGHTGTLDPAASGVLPLVIGRATRLAQFLSSSDKAYDAIIRLGMRTDSADAEGRMVGEIHTGPLPSCDDVDRALDVYRGSFMQRPPAYSAKKVGGRRSHRLARQAARAPARSGAGAAAPPTVLDPVRVTARAIEITEMRGADVGLRLTCSAGFYVRSLADDLGEALGCGAHLLALRRTRSGDFELGDAIELTAIEQHPDEAVHRLIPLAQMLPGTPALVLTSEEVRRVCSGLDLAPAVGPDQASQSGAGQETRPASGSEAVRLLDGHGDLVAVARRVESTGLLHPSIVLR